jgi:serine/threonine protein kinase/tetratricopeptide (TPR) repeat protein
MSANRAREIFIELVAHVPPEQWEGRLAEWAGEDQELHRKVASLLAAHRQADSFLEQPASPLGGTADDAPASAAPEGPPAEPKSTEQPGLVLAGRYKLLEQIGEGGMGSVWMAQQTEPVKRLVAVKLIKPGMDSKQVLARFESERQAVALMDHPNIAKVLDAGAAPDGRPFFVMELVKGVPITKYCDEHRLTPRQRLELLVPLCQAIQHAHHKGIIHRDIKPSNVLVALYDDRPVPKVIDFGVAKATGQQLTEQTLHTGFAAVVGTVEYMSPEQASFNQLDVDTRSDIYSLGVLLYELLAGSPPFTRKELEKAGMLEMLRVIREQAPSKPSTKLSTADGLPTLAANRGTEPKRLAALVRGELDWIVMKALEKDRSRRYETANGFAMDVQRYLADEPVQACPPSPWYRFRKFVRRNKRAVLAALLILLALVAGVIGTTWGLIRAEKANADLAAKNAELADEQAKVQARFELAQKAIALFHTGVSEDMLLKNAEFKELRTKLLKEAAGFYADLEKLLAGQTDAKSRKALAAAYFQLGELTDKIGSSVEALAVQRKALALRRELAAAEGADVETRLDVARSLGAEGGLLYYTGDPTGALRACEELRDIATALEDESATDAVRTVLAQSHVLSGYLLRQTGKPAEALQAYQKALAIRQKLADAHPAVGKYQSDLAHTHNHIGLLVLMWMGKPEEALTASRKALAIQQKLADANPAVIAFQYGLAISYDHIGWCLLNMGKPVEGAEADRKASDIMQKLVDDHPAITLFQAWLASFQFNIGRALDRQKRLAEAFTALEKGLAILQKLAKADPNHAFLRRTLGESHAFRGGARARAGQPAEAAADLRRALELWATLPSLDIEIQVERSRALALLAGLGGDAKSGVTAAEARTFADQSVAALADAVKTGWALPSELKEPDFDALRGREDFQRLAAEVEKKAEKSRETTPPPEKK